MASFFQEAASSYTPTDNSTELQREKSADRLLPEVHGLYAIDAVYPGLRESDPERFKQIVAEKCPFIYNNYKGVLACWMRSPKEKSVFINMVRALKQIETGNVTQHEASQIVGACLQPYIPSEIDPTRVVEGYVNPTKPMSWAEWKKRNVK